MSEKIREASQAEKLLYFCEEECFTPNSLTYIVYSSGFDAGIKFASLGLEKRVESIKCCGNCKHFIDNQYGIITDFTWCENCVRNNFPEDPEVLEDNWEMKE